MKQVTKIAQQIWYKVAAKIYRDCERVTLANKYNVTDASLSKVDILFY